MYQGAGSSSPLSDLDVKSLGEVATRSKYASAAADHDDVLIARLQKAKEALAVRKADLERQRAAAKAEQDAGERGEGQDRCGQPPGTRARTAGQGRDRRRSSSRRRHPAPRPSERAAQAGPPRTTGRSGGRAAIPPNFPNVPAPNAGAAAAVAFAKAQVGKGYVYATSGPDTFDCSGLTAAAWQRGGVGLAHYSGAQYQQTMRIGPNDLQPGDLVFYGPGGSNHVEIYIGGGMVVSASNPSTGVKLAGVRYGSASGYGRVRG